MLQASNQKVYVNSGNEDVIKLITRPSSLILDVGCGGGSLAGILSGSGHTVDGITISEEECKLASDKARSVYIHNLEDGLPGAVRGGNYDYIICSHILEHIVYPTQLLEDIKHALKPGGELIVALPNIMHYRSRLKLLMGEFNYKSSGIWDYTHVKWYTLSTARKLLEERGFNVTLLTVTGELPYNSLFSKLLPGKIRRILYNGLTNISKGFFGYQILIKAVKPD